VKRILVIDDDEDLREMILLILLGAGFDAQPARDGADGLARLRESAFDLMITDIFMPDQDGIETIAEVRRLFPEMKIVAMSGGGKSSRAAGYLRTAMEIGANATLSKPFEQDDLLAIVRRLV
jgi:CheY-like chemotaxis protein